MSKTQLERLLESARTGGIEDKRQFAFFCLRAEQGGPHYLLAYEFFKQLAAVGDTDSQYQLGLMYLQGQGKPANRDIAVQWLTKAAQNKNHHAQARLKEICPQEEFDFPDPDPATDCTPPASTPKKPTFSDLAFKKDENGNLVSQVINLGTSRLSEEDSCDTSLSRLHTTYPRSVVNPLEQLDRLIGLRGVKKQIDLIHKKLLFDRKRVEGGFQTHASSNHFIFTGNPGTGKTEVARILGSLLREVGFLSRGHVVEVDRSNLVGGYVGHTALLTQDAIRQSQGGLLFIDEAHSLWGGGFGQDFGYEAISTLVKAMEDYRRDFVVVMAGYPQDMKSLLSANHGLSSRVRHQLVFEDYNAEEMTQIFESLCADNHYILHEQARSTLDKIIRKTIAHKGQLSGNGRFVRNVFEKTLENMARRVTQSNDYTDLQTIMFMDIPSAEDAG